ncbi:MAG: hypothetical protein V4813_12035 [Gemmatimonadota bacterium]
MRWIVAPHRLLLVSVASLLACTEPTAPRDEPAFLTPVPHMLFTETERQLDPLRLACPSMAVNPDATQRRRVPGSTATMAFPATMPFQQAGFGAHDGGVISVGRLGLIAVAYDGMITADAASGSRARRLPLIPWYSSWCATSVAGRPAVLQLDTQMITNEELATSFQYFSNDMVLMLIEPSGRRMNIRLIGSSRNTFGTLETIQVASLLQIASSVEW